MFEIRLRRIDDFHAVGSMLDEKVLPLSLRECESQLVGSYLKLPSIIILLWVCHEDISRFQNPRHTVLAVRNVAGKSGI